MPFIMAEGEGQYLLLLESKLLWVCFVANNFIHKLGTLSLFVLWYELYPFQLIDDPIIGIIYIQLQN